MSHLSFIYRLFLLLLLPVFPAIVRAQEGCQYDKLFVDYTATESTCQRNGTLTFTPRGEHATNYQNFTYEIRSMVSGGVNIPAAVGEPQGDGSVLIAQVPSGVYRVIVRAKCIADPNYSLQDFVLENVIVPGNYQVPNVYFDAYKSRGSYAACPSGRIVLDVSGGRGNFKFKVVKSPENKHNGEVTPTASGTSYTLPFEKYPPGEYTIEVHDVDCDYTAVTNFQLTEFTDLPTLSSEYSAAWYPITTPGPDCHAVRTTVGVNSNFYNNRPAIRDLIESGFYEFGVSHVDREPVAYYPIKMSGETIMSLGTTKVNELNDPNKFKVTIRLRDCPDIKRSFTTDLRRRFTYSQQNYCGYSVISPYPWTDYDGHYCFPLTARLYTDQAAFQANPDSPLETKVLENHYDKVSFQLNAGESRFLTVTDVDGQLFFQNTYNASNFNFYRTSSDVISCEGFQTSFRLDGAQCEGVTYKIYDISTPGNPIFLCERNPDEVSCLLPYDKDLRAVMTIPREGQEDLTFSRDFREPFPNYNITLQLNNVDRCQTNIGSLRIYHSNRNLPAGTRAVITGPNEFRQEMTTTSSGQHIYFPTTRLLPGVYEARIEIGDCYVKTASLTLPVLLEVKNFTVRKERDCAQMKVNPSGMLIYMGNEVPNQTTFFIASGPQGGYDPSQRITQTQAQNGAYFTLSKPGIYMVGISNESSCALQQIPVEFERINLRLDNTRTIAFACLDNSTSGHIYVRATEGYGDYTYSLYDEDNETEEDGAIGVTVGDRVYFQHGEQNEVYTVRITDACNNRFSQQITILDLSQQTIGSAIRSTVCVGDPIEFTSLPLGSYYWEKETAPNSGQYTFFSNEQNPVIPTSKPSDSGRYRVTVEASGCTQKSTGYVNIQVVPCYAPVNPSLMNKYGNF